MIGCSVAFLTFQRAEVRFKFTFAMRVVPHEGSWQQANVCRPLIYKKSIPAFAALVVFTAKQWKVDRPRQRRHVLGLNLMTSRKHAHCGCNIAASAVALIHHWL